MAAAEVEQHFDKVVDMMRRIDLVVKAMPAGGPIVIPDDTDDDVKKILNVFAVPFMGMEFNADRLKGIFYTGNVGIVQTMMGLKGAIIEHADAIADMRIGDFFRQIPNVIQIVPEAPPIIVHQADDVSVESSSDEEL
jgi:hypothetical protein